MTEYSPATVVDWVHTSAKSPDARRLLGLMLVVVMAEAAILQGVMTVGLVFHSLAVLALLWVVFITQAEVVAYEALLFVPLLRLLNLGTGDVGLHPYVWLALVYVMVVGGLIVLMMDREFTAASVGVWPPPTGRAFMYLFVGILTGSLLGFTQWAFELESSPVEVTPINAIIAILVVGVLVGFVEELLFRGILQPATADIIGTPGAILTVSVVFGFMHSVWMEPMNVLFAFLVSLYLGWEYARTRNFWYIWLVHTMINTVAYAVLPLYFGVG